jgi:hypothetical protein
LGCHNAEFVLEAQKDAREIGIDHVLPLVQWKVNKRTEPTTDAGIVDGAVKPTVIVDCRVNDRSNIIFFSEVGGHCKCLATTFLNRSNDGLGGVTVNVTNDDGSTLNCEESGSGFANTASSASYKSNFAFY